MSAGFSVENAEVRQHMEDGTASDDTRVLPLARKWLELFPSYAGDSPQTQAKIRAAHQAEPELLAGTFVDGRLLKYVTQAVSGLQPA